MSARSPGLCEQVGETFRLCHVPSWPGGGRHLARQKGPSEMDPYIALVCFPVVFLGELPDKTMFANLVLATRGRPFHVWLGAAVAFAVHVAIAVTVGVALFRLLPHRAVDGVVAGMFLLGAAYAWWKARTDGAEEGAAREVAPALTRHGVTLTAFAVIFVAEWGDLTQLLAADLAAKYHAPVSVAVGSVAALWCVAGLAVAGGRTLLRVVRVRTIRRATAVVLLALAAYAAWTAAH